ncbi:MAG TPA: hypothetical protein PLF61_04525, partial [Candidatus Goldiibacteriota bacterium]|nr:hypothetical protein [Candidatus Goldiibacteriota bacterium]
PYFIKYLNKKPFVLTVHDMIHEKFNNMFSKNDKTSEQKRYLDAIKAYQEVVDTGSEEMQLEALYRIGDIYSTIEDSEHAIETLSKLIPLKPKDNIFRATGLLNLAIIYEEKQRWVDAVKIYELIIDSGCKKEYIDGAKVRINEIKSAYPDLFKKVETTEIKDKKETKKEEKKK